MKTTTTNKVQLNTYYSQLVASMGFEAVRVALELTVRELNVLLVWERSKVDAMKCTIYCEDAAVYAEEVMDGMVNRMKAVDDIIALGYTWEGDLGDALDGVYGKDWGTFTTTPSGQVVSTDYLGDAHNQARWGFAG